MLSKTIPRLLRRHAFVPLLAVLCLLCAHSAAAAGYSVTAEIPVCVQAATGENAADAVSYFSLSATAGAPMPDAASLRIDGTGCAAFGPIAYTVPGDYTYTVCQTAAGAVYHRDTTVYSVTVRVVNNDAGALSAEVWAVKSGGTDKVSRLVFTAKRIQPAATAVPDSTTAVSTKSAPAAVRRGVPQTKDDFTPLSLLLCCLGSAGAMLILYRRKNK